jgi:NifB/MoaA-like Fe-S oxidoreductase
VERVQRESQFRYRLVRDIRELFEDLDEIDGREAIVAAIMEKVGETTVDPDVIAQWARETIYDFARNSRQSLETRVKRSTEA